MNRFAWVLAAALIGATAVWAAEEKEEEALAQTVTGFRVPEYDSQNKLKSQLFGDFAKILPDGVIEITQLKIDFYDEGQVNMTVTAPHCTYKQETGAAESDSEVRIAGKDMVVTGKGFSWDGRDEIFQIFHEAKVVLKNARKQVDTGAEE